MHFLALARFKFCLQIVAIIGSLLWGGVLAESGHKLSPLRSAPDWSKIDDYQYTQTLDSFKTLIKNVLCPKGAFWKYAQIDDRTVVLFETQDRVNVSKTIYFAETIENCRKMPRTFNILSSRPDAPLTGYHICIDPGHIGGEYSKMEERWFKIENHPPVEEAALNRLVGVHLEKLLISAGAKVSWTIREQIPATLLRPSDLRYEALKAMLVTSSMGLPKSIERRLLTKQEQLFYRNAEIGARAEKVEALKPDLTLCLHFNAAPWGDPDHPKLVDENRLVVFVGGAYLENEMDYEDQRFDLVLKALQQSHPIELTFATSIANAMKEKWQLPPEEYKNWDSVKQLGSSPYVYARNLAANRQFPGPVIFVEGPYMNNRETYLRLQAGDYEGIKTFNNKQVPNIFMEYAEIVFKGILDGLIL